MPMGDFAFSMQMRDTIDRMIKESIDLARPRYRYATVKTIDRVARKVDVLFNGESNPVRVNMGSIQPRAVNQIVRVEGIGTDKFITDVIGEPYQYYAPRRGTAEPYYSSGRVKVIWEGDTAYSGPYPVINSDDLRGGATVTSLEVPGHGTFVLPVDGATTHPKWHNLALQNGFTNYTGIRHWNPIEIFNYAQFTRTSVGIIKLKGLLNRPGGTPASGTVIGQLPEGFRPAGRGIHIAQTSGATHEAGSVEIAPDGRIITRNVATGWVSLENIQFPAADVAPDSAWTVPPLQNGFRHYVDVYGGAWAKMGWWQDSEGVVWRRGLGHHPSPPGGVSWVWGPQAGITADKNLHHRVTSADGPGFLQTNSLGEIQWPAARFVSGAFFSLEGTQFINTSSALYQTPGLVKELGGQHSWTNYDPAQFSKGELIKLPSGMVHLKGLIKSPSPYGNPFVILPVTHRPGGLALLGIVSTEVTTRIDIHGANGHMTSGAGFSSGWVSLESVCFVAEDQSSF